MKKIKRWRRAATEYLGWSLPSEVAPGYPTTFKDFQARRAELHRNDDYSLQRHFNELERLRKQGKAS